MNKAKLEAAMYEARRFLQKANDLCKKANYIDYGCAQSKESGSVKRSSMDLTRALADLRRSGD